MAARDARDDVRIIALWDSKSSLTFIYIYIGGCIGLCSALDLRLLFLMFCQGWGGSGERVQFKVTFTRNGPINNRHSRSLQLQLVATITPRPTDDKCEENKIKEVLCTEHCASVSTPDHYSATARQCCNDIIISTRVGIILLLLLLLPLDITMICRDNSRRPDLQPQSRNSPTGSASSSQYAYILLI